MIGEDIEVQIASIDGDTVKLAIRAPREIPIHRKEVFENIKATNTEAAIDSSSPNIASAAQNLAAAKR